MADPTPSVPETIRKLQDAVPAAASSRTTACLRPPASNFNLTLMNFYPHGTAYTISEHCRWLEQAGCVEPGHATMPNGATLIWAVKAGG